MWTLNQENCNWKRLGGGGDIYICFMRCKSHLVTTFAISHWLCYTLATLKGFVSWRYVYMHARTHRHFMTLYQYSKTLFLRWFVVRNLMSMGSILSGMGLWSSGMDWVGWCSSNALGSSDWGFLWFLQSLKANARIVPWFCHDCFLPNPY
jgi:hypothetical protein